MPKKIKIGGVVYEVIVSSDVLVLNNKECCGVIEYDNAKIKINNNRDIQKQLQTFWHEVIHAVIRERNFNIEGVTEETICDEIGIALHQIFVDNPNLLKENMKND